MNEDNEPVTVHGDGRVHLAIAEQKGLDDLVGLLAIELVCLVIQHGAQANRALLVIAWWEIATACIENVRRIESVTALTRGLTSTTASAAANVLQDAFPHPPSS